MKIKLWNSLLLEFGAQFHLQVFEFMTTSCHGNSLPIPGPLWGVFCEGNPPVTDGFSSQWAVKQAWIFFDVSVNKLLNKKSSYQWFKMSCGLCGTNVVNTNFHIPMAQYSISQEICTRFLLCCALLWLYIDWFSHIHQAYFTGKATLMNMDKYFMWIHYERLHNHNKAKHNKTVCIFLGIYCSYFILYHNETIVIMLRTTFSNASLWNNILALWLKYHWIFSAILYEFGSKKFWKMRATFLCIFVIFSYYITIYIYDLAVTMIWIILFKDEMQ